MAELVDETTTYSIAEAAERLGWITLITRLRATGMPIRMVRSYAELCRLGESNELGRLDLLYQHRDRVLAQLDQVTDHLGAMSEFYGVPDDSEAVATIRSTM
jgi:DNA-binding transcriptional MerR regulator